MKSLRLKRFHTDNEVNVAHVNVHRSTNTSWRVSLPPDELAQTDRWTFRFSPAGRIPSADEVSSPRVIVTNSSTDSSSTVSGTTSTSTASSSTFSGTTSTSTAPTAATSIAQPSQQSTPPSPGGGFSPGAIAGVAVGVSVGTALVTSVGWLLVRKFQLFSAAGRSDVLAGNSHKKHSTQMYPLSPERANLDSYSSGNRQPYSAELPTGNQPTELPLGTRERDLGQ